MGISLRKAEKSDCKLIHKMQVEAFCGLLLKYKDFNTNPGAESLEKIEQKMAQTFSQYYLLYLDSNAIGAIRILRLKDERFRISPMFVLPQYQGLGYAQQAIADVEALYPEARRWELDTIKQEPKLCYLYEKMGYKATGKEENIQDNMTIVNYAK